MKTYISTIVHYGNLFRLTALCLGAMLAAGCEDFVQVELPDSQLNTVDVFRDRATADAAMANIYAEMRSSGLLNGGRNGISYQIGHYTDELQSFASASSPAVPYYNNALLPSTASVGTWWNIAYNQIYASNAVIEGVAESTGLTQTDRQQLTGEALFARAMLHYYLNCLFGDVPYITTTNYEVSRSASRMETSELLDALIADLDQAVLLLPEDYITADRNRPNRYAAAALRARIQLAAGRWADAADSASMVLNNDALYGWEVTLEGVFLKDSRSTIWQFNPGQDGANTLEAQTFLFTSGPPSQYALSPQLLEAFEPDDQRKQAWLLPVIGGNDTWYAVRKYRERTPTSSSLEHSIVFRLSEQMLIRAEARARQGELIGALGDLDTIRLKAGLQPSTATSQQEVLDAILHERRVELFAEFGHRFIDMKRFGVLDSALSPIKAGWDSSDRLLPLPEAEILLNPNLGPQNPGY